MKKILSFEFIPFTFLQSKMKILLALTLFVGVICKSFSQTGSLVYTDKYNIYRADSPTDSSPVVLYSYAGYNGLGLNHPRVSPNGEKIAFLKYETEAALGLTNGGCGSQGRWVVWVMDITGANAQRLYGQNSFDYSNTCNMKYQSWYFAWDPSGDFIYVALQFALQGRGVILKISSTPTTTPKPLEVFELNDSD